MSSSKQTPEKLSMERPEMRHRTVTSVRPVTISTCFPTVTSAPNPGSTKTVVEVSKPVSASRSMTTRPRMPDPPSELPGELVNVIHVTGASPSVPTPPYINVPTKDMPEYVDMTEYDEMPSEDQQPAKPPYVNVPIDPTASPNRRKNGFIVCKYSIHICIISHLR